MHQAQRTLPGLPRARKALLTVPSAPLQPSSARIHASAANTNPAQPGEAGILHPRPAQTAACPSPSGSARRRAGRCPALGLTASRSLQQALQPLLVRALRHVQVGEPGHAARSAAPPGPGHPGACSPALMAGRGALEETP